MMRFFPFMAFAVLAYGVVVAVMGIPLERVLFSIGLPSGASFAPTTGETLLAVAILVLFFEIMNAASARSSSIINHGLSLLVFVGCGLAFLLLPAFGTGTFLVITVMSLIDVVAGYSISILTARRDLTVGPQD